MNKLHFRIGNDIIHFTFTEEKEGCKLTCDKQLYNILKKANEGKAIFPLEFLNQINGMEYELFDCIEGKDSQIIAFYNYKTIY